MIVEDEYSYPPESADVSQATLERLGVQLAPRSKRHDVTTRVYRAPLSDAAIKRCRTKGRG